MDTLSLSGNKKSQGAFGSVDRDFSEGSSLTTIHHKFIRDWAFVKTFIFLDFNCFFLLARVICDIWELE